MPRYRQIRSEASRLQLRLPRLLRLTTQLLLKALLGSILADPADPAIYRATPQGDYRLFTSIYYDVSEKYGFSKKS